MAPTPRVNISYLPRSAPIERCSDRRFRAITDRRQTARQAYGSSGAAQVARHVKNKWRLLRHRRDMRKGMNAEIDE